MRISSSKLFIVGIVSLLAFSLFLSGCSKKPEKQAELKYPNAPITAICPWGAGGSSDIVFRSYMRSIAQELGGEINVLNVTGGEGSIGIAQALNAPADGYTLAMLNYNTISNEITGITPDTYRDFAAINMFTLQGINLVVHTGSGWNTFEDFRKAALEAKANGKKLQIAVVGFWLHAAGMMANAAGIMDCLVFVPTDGNSEQMVELLGRHCDAVVTTLTVVLPYLEAGTMKVLGTMEKKRIPDFPDIPTFVEMGYPSVVIAGFRVLGVHKDTPQPIIDRLRVAAKNAYDKEFLEWAKTSNADPVYMDYKESTEYMEKLAPTIRQTMKDLGLI